MAQHYIGNNSVIDEDSNGNYRVQTNDGTFVVDGSATISELQSAIDDAASSGGDATVGDTINVQNQTGERFAREFPGSDLATKIQNAINDLPDGRGRVRVTPKEDGTVWDWGSSLSLDLSQHNGLHLDIDANCRIDYPGDGWCLTVDGTSGSVPNTSHPFWLSGGRWDMSGDPEGWLRIQDVYMPRIKPAYVAVRNSTGDAVGISCENVDTYTESARLDGHFEADIGVDFLPASVTGGSSGTHSFHDTQIEGIRINAWNIGIRFRGWPQYSVAISPTIWLKTEGATGIMYDAPRMDGMVILAPKVENVSNSSGTSAITTTDNYDGWYGPLLVGGMFTADTMVNAAGAGDRVMQLVQRNAGFRVWDRNGGATMQFDGGSGDLTIDGAINASNV